MSMMMIIIIKLENDSVIEKSLEELNGIKIDNDYDQDDKMMMVFWVNATTKKNNSEDSSPKYSKKKIDTTITIPSSLDQNDYGFHLAFNHRKSKTKYYESLNDK